ncbi:hypothetical protein ACIA6D_12925 [Streptomyces cacaoi]|uniref:hypothetical protein n=1 Tax=Streptomyces cacaoi TaxID=1898 RepID=UPI00374801C5
MDAEMQTTTRADDEPPSRARGLGRTDRHLTVERWFLSTLPGPARDRARQEWEKYRLAVLPLGTLFSAVRLPGCLVPTVVGSGIPSGEVDRFLSMALHSGPVICDPHGQRYYALVPADMPHAWRRAAERWRTQGVRCLGQGAYLGLPRVDVDQPSMATASYWSVPMASAATLCVPLDVAQLIGGGRWHESGEGQAG